MPFSQTKSYLAYSPWSLSSLLKLFHSCWSKLTQHIAHMTNNFEAQDRDINNRRILLHLTWKYHKIKKSYRIKNNRDLYYDNKLFKYNKYALSLLITTPPLCPNSCPSKLWHHNLKTRICTSIFHDSDILGFDPSCWYFTGLEMALEHSRSDTMIKFVTMETEVNHIRVLYLILNFIFNTLYMHVFMFLPAA